MLHRETNVSLQDAVGAAARMHDDVVRSFEHHAALVAPQQRYFVDALEGWIRANVDWSIETGRYGRAEIAKSA